MISGFLRSRKMASRRDRPCDSVSCRDSRQETKSHGQSLQEAIYRAQQPRQEARDRGQSRRKSNMTDNVRRKRKLGDWFIPCEIVMRENKNPETENFVLQCKQHCFMMWGGCGGAMALGSFQCLGVLLIWNMVGQGPTVLAVDRDCLDILFCTLISLFFLPLRLEDGSIWPEILSQTAVKPKLTSQPTSPL